MPSLQANFKTVVEDFKDENVPVPGTPCQVPGSHLGSAASGIGTGYPRGPHENVPVPGTPCQVPGSHLGSAASGIGTGYPRGPHEGSNGRVSESRRINDFSEP